MEFNTTKLRRLIHIFIAWVWISLTTQQQQQYKHVGRKRNIEILDD